MKEKYCDSSVVNLLQEAGISPIKYSKLASIIQAELRNKQHIIKNLKRQNKMLKEKINEHSMHVNH